MNGSGARKRVARGELVCASQLRLEDSCYSHFRSSRSLVRNGCWCTVPWCTKYEFFFFGVCQTAGCWIFLSYYLLAIGQVATKHDAQQLKAPTWFQQWTVVVLHACRAVFPAKPAGVRVRQWGLAISFNFCILACKYIKSSFTVIISLTTRNYG